MHPRPRARATTVLSADPTIYVELGGTFSVPLPAVFSEHAPLVLGVSFFRWWTFTYDLANRRIGLHPQPDTPFRTGVLVQDGNALG